MFFLLLYLLKYHSFKTTTGVSTSFTWRSSNKLRVCFNFLKHHPRGKKIHLSHRPKTSIHPRFGPFPVGTKVVERHGGGILPTLDGRLHRLLQSTKDLPVSCGENLGENETTILGRENFLRDFFFHVFFG